MLTTIKPTVHKGPDAMTLTQAKEIADNPSGFQPEQWLNAFIRLRSPKVEARMRNTNERTAARYERRLRYLGDYLTAAGMKVDGRNISLADRK